MKPTLLSHIITALASLAVIGAFAILIPLPARACDSVPSPKKNRAFFERIIIPSIHFEDTPLQDAIDFVACKTVELDNDTDPATRGFLIRWIRESDLTQTTATAPSTTQADPQGEVEPDPGPPINYIADYVSVLTILQELAKQAQCDLHVTTIGVFLTPAGKLPSEHPKYPGARVRETLYRYEAD